MKVRSRVWTHPQEFLDRAGELLEDEARNSLVLGIARRMLSNPERYEDVALFVVEHDGKPVAAAMITPPFHLLVCEIASEDAVRGLAQTVSDDQRSIPGVTGERRTVDSFTRVWTELTGATAHLEMEQGIYSIEKVQEVPTAEGRPRQATTDDVDLIDGWMRDFAAEALPGGAANVDRLAQITRRRLEGADGAGFWLWEVDDEAVAISGHSSPTGAGIRINGVYTPPAMRGNGYATSLVAHQSRRLLDNGYRFCCLYTDLANPTSNAMYRRIGYRQVAESAMYRFSR